MKRVSRFNSVLHLNANILKFENVQNIFKCSIRLNAYDIFYAFEHIIIHNSLSDSIHVPNGKIKLLTILIKIIVRCPRIHGKHDNRTKRIYEHGQQTMNKSQNQFNKQITGFALNTIPYTGVCDIMVNENDMFPLSDHRRNTNYAS